MAVHMTPPEHYLAGQQALAVAGRVKSAEDTTPENPEQAAYCLQLAQTHFLAAIAGQLGDRNGAADLWSPVAGRTGWYDVLITLPRNERQREEEIFNPGQEQHRDDSWYGRS